MNQSHTLRYFWTITNVHSRAHPARILDSHTPRDGLAPAPVILSLRWAGSAVRTSLVFYFIFSTPEFIIFSEVHTLVDTTAHTHNVPNNLLSNSDWKISLHSDVWTACQFSRNYQSIHHRHSLNFTKRSAIIQTIPSNPTRKYLNLGNLFPPHHSHHTLYIWNGTPQKKVSSIAQHWLTDWLLLPQCTPRADRTISTDDDDDAIENVTLNGMDIVPSPQFLLYTHP